VLCFAEDLAGGGTAQAEVQPRLLDVTTNLLSLSALEYAGAAEFVDKMSTALSAALSPHPPAVRGELVCSMLGGVDGPCSDTVLQLMQRVIRGLQSPSEADGPARLATEPPPQQHLWRTAIEVARQRPECHAELSRTLSLILQECKQGGHLQLHAAARRSSAQGARTPDSSVGYRSASSPPLYYSPVEAPEVHLTHSSMDTRRLGSLRAAGPDAATPARGNSVGHASVPSPPTNTPPPRVTVDDDCCSEGGSLVSDAIDLVEVNTPSVRPRASSDAAAKENSSRPRSKSSLAGPGSSHRRSFRDARSPLRGPLSPLSPMSPSQWC
jgi:hypothetical protein